MVGIPALPDALLVHLQLPLSNEQSAERIEAAAHLLIGQAWTLLCSADSLSQWLMQEPCSRLAIAGIWERTWLEYSTTVREARNTVAQLRMSNYSSGLLSKISTPAAPSWVDAADWFNSALYPYEMNLKYGFK